MTLNIPTTATAEEVAAVKTQAHIDNEALDKAVKKMLDPNCSIESKLLEINSLDNRLGKIHSFRALFHFSTSNDFSGWDKIHNAWLETLKTLKPFESKLPTIKDAKEEHFEIDTAGLFFYLVKERQF